MADEPSNESIAQNSNGEPSGGEFTADPTADQMHLWHIFLWMTCCSVVLALVRVLLDRIPQGSNMIPLAIVLATLLGTDLMGLILAIQYWRRGQPLEPGHWLMVAQGIEGGILFVPLLAEFKSDWTVLAIFLPSLALIVVMAVAQRDRSQAKRWRVIFRILLAMGVVQVLGIVGLISAFSAPSAPWGFGLTIAMVLVAISYLWWIPVAVAAITDRFQKRRYGWLHRVGIAVSILSGLARLALWATQFLSRH